MRSISGSISNATIQQRITVLRLFYSYLIEEAVCDKNPVLRDGGRPLVHRYRRLPWIPSEADWQAILAATREEPIRNRVMLAFAYDAALRREELCGLCTADIDPSLRMLRIRAENTKGRRDRIVPYSTAGSALLQQYLNKDHNYRHKQFTLQERLMELNFVGGVDHAPISDAQVDGSRFFGFAPGQIVHGDFLAFTTASTRTRPSFTRASKCEAGRFTGASKAFSFSRTSCWVQSWA